MNVDSGLMWSQLSPVLHSFATRVMARYPFLYHELGHSANTAFVLRAYVGFCKAGSGDEVAVVVDAASMEKQVSVTSDLAFDDGKIILAGPSTILPLYNSDDEAETAFAEWLNAFKGFLDAAESKLTGIVPNLS